MSEPNIELIVSLHLQESANLPHLAKFLLATSPFQRLPSDIDLRPPGNLHSEAPMRSQARDFVNAFVSSGNGLLIAGAAVFCLPIILLFLPTIVFLLAIVSIYYHLKLRNVKPIYPKKLQNSGELVSAKPGLALLTTDLKEEKSIPELKVKGKIPAWLSGYFYRNGPARWRFGDEELRHWFDGETMLHAFHVQNKKVSYRNRFLGSEMYKETREKGKLSCRAFGTDPCASLFGRFKSLATDSIYDEAGVNIGLMEGELFAMTESPYPVQFDRETLENYGAIVSDDDVGNNGFSTAHPHYTNDGYTINYLLSLGSSLKYVIFAVPTESTASREGEGHYPSSLSPSRSSQSPSRSTRSPSSPRKKRNDAAEEKTNETKEKLSNGHHVTERDDEKRQTGQYGKKRTAEIKRKIIAEIPVKDNLASYMHSFAMTRKYVILVEMGTKISLSSLLDAMAGYIFTGKSPGLGNMLAKWSPGHGTRFIVVNITDGSVRGVYETEEEIFCYHHINAFDMIEDGREKVAIDMMCYNRGAYEHFTLDGLRQDIAPTSFTGGRSVRRYVVDLDSSLEREDGGEEEKRGKGRMAVKRKVLFEGSCEMPRINYELFNARPYQYVYGCESEVWAFRKLVKLNVNTGKVLRWEEEGCFPSEPMFIAKPGGTKEDEGVVLSVVLDSRKESSFLLFLSASDFKEIARAEVPHHIPAGLHGYWAS